MWLGAGDGHRAFSLPHIKSLSVDVVEQIGVLVFKPSVHEFHASVAGRKALNINFVTDEVIVSL